MEGKGPKYVSILTQPPSKDPGSINAPQSSNPSRPCNDPPLPQHSIQLPPLPDRDPRQFIYPTTLSPVFFWGHCLVHPCRFSHSGEGLRSYWRDHTGFGSPPMAPYRPASLPVQPDAWPQQLHRPQRLRIGDFFNVVEQFERKRESTVVPTPQRPLYPGQRRRRAPHYHRPLHRHDDRHCHRCNGCHLCQHHRHHRQQKTNRSHWVANK